MSADLQLKRSPSNLAALFAKGVAMGMGDAVPGISGGTIAVITGIYEELIGSIGRIDLTAVSLFFTGQIGKCWSHINGSFLTVLALGVLAGLVVSANSVLYLLENHFEPLMGFFIGLVLASTYFLKAEFNGRSWRNLFAALLGIAGVTLISTVPQQAASISFISVFFYGAIAICAMILPGLSGAFILLILGVYEFILNALIQFQLSYIAVFGAGCICGLLAFARLLNWLLHHHRHLSYSFLTGMLVASVVTLWPWQAAMTALHEDTQNHLVATMRLSPFEYLSQTGNDPALLATVVSFLLGAIAVFLVHELARESNHQKVDK
ncbi:MAG: putative membrane protein [Pseudohongiellaceae bacterium]